MRLNVVSFDVPYPPDYGGAIDVYFKLKSLHKMGVEIDMHCFHYGRYQPKELNDICANVYYYRRFRNPFLYLCRKPFVVASRSNRSVINNLLKNDDPILFEGLHSCYYLNDHRLKDRIKIVRTHNIEHHYYDQLSKAVSDQWKKFYFNSESKKLEAFENILLKADFIAAISENDTQYLSTKYPSVFHLPIFHGNTMVSVAKSIGNYALYHGNLSVSENEKAAMFLMKEIFNDLEIQLIIAGRKPSKALISAADKLPNIVVMRDVSPEELQNLVINAQVNILPTFQATGIKLKVINALYNGRHCIVNTNMVTDSDLDSCCVIADSADEMKQAVLKCMKQEFSETLLQKRKSVLERRYSNQTNIRLLLDKIYPQNHV